MPPSESAFFQGVSAEVLGKPACVPHAALSSVPHPMFRILRGGCHDLVPFTEETQL